MTAELRHTKLIDWRFQGRLIGQLVTINMVVLGLCGYIIYLFMHNEMQTNLAMAQVKYRTMADVLMPVFLTLSIVNLLILGVVAAIAVLFASHRIAGPLYRFKTALAQLAQGNLRPHTRIREDDQLQDLAKNLAEVSERFHHDLSAIASVLQESRPALAHSAPDVLQRIEEVLNRYQL